MSELQDDIAAIGRIGAVPTILRVMSEITGLRLALVARVTDHTWTACAVLDRMGFGLEVGGQLEVATTLCSQVRDTRQGVVIEHASEDPQYCDHPTPKMYGFESYISLPIYRTDGEYFGTICALDSRPAVLRDGKTVETVQLFADLISMQLTADEASSRDREELAAERRTAMLREQFIAVLGHDLRNPLSSIVTGSEFLLDLPLGPTERTVLERVRSSGGRMARLIDDVMDFARGRLGGGMPIDPEETEVGPLVAEVVEEIAAARPRHTLRVAAAQAGVAHLDRTRVAQLVSNLVANAVEHSPPEEPVSVTVEGSADGVRIAVHNRGEPIDPQLLPHLFEPYVRAGRRDSQPGLGLGLYIAAQIAHAHGGTIEVDSSAHAGTTFTVDLPRSR